MTHTPAAGPCGPVTTPPMSSAPTLTVRVSFSLSAATACEAAADTNTTASAAAMNVLFMVLLLGAPIVLETGRGYRLFFETAGPGVLARLPALVPLRTRGALGPLMALRTLDAPFLAKVRAQVLAVGTQVALVFLKVFALRLDLRPFPGGARHVVLVHVLDHFPMVLANLRLVARDVALVLADVLAVFTDVGAQVRACVRRGAAGERASHREKRARACNAENLFQHDELRE